MNDEGKAELNTLASNVYHNKGNNAMSQLTSLDSLLAVYAQLEEMEKAGTAPANAKNQIYNLIQDNYKSNMLSIIEKGSLSEKRLALKILLTKKKSENRKLKIE